MTEVFVRGEMSLLLCTHYVCRVLLNVKHLLYNWGHASSASTEQFNYISVHNFIVLHVMAAHGDTASYLIPRDLTLPGRCLPPAMPLIISTQDRDFDSCKLETNQQQGQHQKL